MKTALSSSTALSVQAPTVLTTSLKVVRGAAISVKTMMGVGGMTDLEIGVLEETGTMIGTQMTTAKGDASTTETNATKQTGTDMMAETRGETTVDMIADTRTVAHRGAHGREVRLEKTILVTIDVMDDKRETH